MNAILSHQKASVDGFDTVVIDGNVGEYNGTNDQVEAMKKLNDPEEKRDCSFLKFLVPGSSDALKVLTGKKSKGVWVSSHFAEKDDKGRFVPFSFWMDSFSTAGEVRMKLEEYARLVKMRLNPSDGLAVEKCISAYPKVKFGLYALLVLLLLILLIIIF
ncbi:MAG: hypothetical protein J5711_08450 [Bacteroidales bacterium]|nr:hypothetical protein [Bacteroidales bacterium]